MITLTTDFGDSHYVGAMKGAILQVHGGARVVDVTHGVAAQDVVGGALALAAAAPYFPPAVHVCVVDPGVGTARRGLLMECERGFLVGPDNGVLAPAARQLGLVRAFSLDNPDLWLPEVSHTFHGRDVFAPVAAHVDRGVAPERAGAEVTDWQDLDFGEPTLLEDGGVKTEVITVDRFGNCVTNAPAAVAHQRLQRGGAALLAGHGSTHTVPFRNTYGEVPPGEAVLLIGSTGRLELSVNQGSAAERFGISAGDVLEVRRE